MFQRIDVLRAPRTGHIVRRGEVTAIPSELVRVFGPPTSGADRESLGAFYFLAADERPYALYFRAHDLGWWATRRLRSSFWRDGEPREFGNGALQDCDVGEFTNWVQGQLSDR